MVGIYKITSPSGKVYIGQSWNIERRRRQYKTLHCKHQFKLYTSLFKHGFENHLFEVIHELPTDIEQEILNNYEYLYWLQYKECGIEMLNLMDPGFGPGRHSQQTREKLRILNLGKHHTTETKNKLRKIHSGRKRSEEDVKKSANGHIGFRHSEESKQKLRDLAKGRVMSEESKEKNRIAHIGKKQTKEHIEKKINSRRRNKSIF